MSVVQHLSHHSGLTFRMGPWKETSHKLPMSSMDNWLQIEMSMVLLSDKPTMWSHNFFSAKAKLDAFCSENIICKEQAPAEWVWEESPDIILPKDRRMKLGFIASSIEGKKKNEGQGERGTFFFLAWQHCSFLTAPLFLLSRVKEEEQYTLYFQSVSDWDRAKLPDGVYCPQLLAKWDSNVKTAHVTITIISGIYSIRAD